MKERRRLLQSKFARRLLLIFVLCALVPLVALAYVTLNQVTTGLRAESETRLHRASKVTALAILARLQQIHSGLVSLPIPEGSDDLAALRTSVGDLHKKLDSLTARLGPEAAFQSVFGDAVDPDALSPEVREAYRLGRPIVTTTRQPMGELRVQIHQHLGPRNGNDLVDIDLVGTISIPFLLDIGDHIALPPMAEFCVLDDQLRVIACSLDALPSIPEDFALNDERTIAGSIDWHQDGEHFLGRYWKLFLEPTFGIPSWTVVLIEPEASGWRAIDSTAALPMRPIPSPPPTTARPAPNAPPNALTFIGAMWVSPLAESWAIAGEAAIITRLAAITAKQILALVFI